MSIYDSHVTPGITSADLIGWIPCHVRLPIDGSPSFLEWRYAGDTALDGPFFVQTADGLALKYPQCEPRFTDLDILKEYVDFPDALRPDALLFHTGRCGSTALSNALRAVKGAVSLSEPTPIVELLRPDRAPRRPSGSKAWGDIRAEILRGAVAAFGLRRRGDERRYFIKFLDWNFLEFAFLRSLWPETPCVFLYRDPIETMVSQLEEPPAWLLLRYFPASFLEMDPYEARKLSFEAYYARILGLFYRRAAEAVGGNVMLLNYAELNAERIESLCELIGIGADEIDSRQLRDSLKLNSKELQSVEIFRSDADEKRARATDKMRAAIGLYAQGPYTRLEALRTQIGIQTPSVNHTTGSVGSIDPDSVDDETSDAQTWSADLNENAANHSESVYALRRMLEFEPESPAIWTKLAAALYSTGDTLEAILLVRHAARFAPSRETYQNLITMLTMSGRYEEAREAHNLTIEKFGDGPTGSRTEC